MPMCSTASCREHLVKRLADLMDFESNQWPWSCTTTGSLKGTSHWRYHAAHRNDEDEDELEEGPTVGPIDCFDMEKFNNLLYDFEKYLPDTCSSNVSPNSDLFASPANETRFDEITANIKKLGPSPFVQTNRDDWREHSAPLIQKIMTGDYGEGVQYLNMEKDDRLSLVDNADCSPHALCWSIDIDSGMGWLSHLGLINKDLQIYLYPFSSRNFGASVHLYLQIDDGKVSVDIIPHFLLGEFGANVQRCIQLYLFLPALHSAGCRSNGVSDQLKDEFIT